MSKLKNLNGVKKFYEWTISIPLLALILFLSGYADHNLFFEILAGVLLIFSVMSAVHHSEIVAHRTNEPYGTIILAVSITIIEVAIIISLMISGGEEYATFARDTVYAAVMLILTGIMGLCLFIGGRKYHTQTFSSDSVRLALVCLISIVAFTMIIPNFTQTQEGPYYARPQILFEFFGCLIIYSAFIMAQTQTHRDYFLVIEESSEEGNNKDTPHHDISNAALVTSLIFLLISLAVVVVLAKTLSHPMEDAIVHLGLPKSLVGIIIAAIILLPEGIAAVTAARRNRIQTSLNLALGSALASIGLTIPVVSLASYLYDFPLVLGLETMPIILLGISIVTVILSLMGGRSNSVYGVVLLVNLAGYIFLTIIP